MVNRRQTGYGDEIRRLRGGKQRMAYIPIRDTAGTLLGNSFDKTEKWKEYFQQQLNVECVVDCKLSILNHLFKNKGDKTQYDDDCGMSVRMVTSKLFTRVILDRVQSLIDWQLLETQLGFRATNSRSTVDQVFKNSMHAETSAPEFQSLGESRGRTVRHIWDRNGCNARRSFVSCTFQHAARLNHQQSDRRRQYHYREILTQKQWAHDHV